MVIVKYVLWCKAIRTIPPELKTAGSPFQKTPNQINILYLTNIKLYDHNINHVIITLSKNIEYYDTNNYRR